MRFYTRRRTLLTLSLIVIVIFMSIYVITTNGPKSIPKVTKDIRNLKQTEYVDRRGIRVIVGHYKGDTGPGINFTKEELNKNNYKPESGVGEGGKPVYLKPHETIRSKRLFHINEFNLVVSDKISIDRELEDVRSASCQNLRYQSKSLPSTSIIIVFHNEAWSTLLRTIHSALNTSPIGDTWRHSLMYYSLEQRYMNTFP